MVWPGAEQDPEGFSGAVVPQIAFRVGSALRGRAVPLEPCGEQPLDDRWRDLVG